VTITKDRDEENDSDIAHISNNPRAGEELLAFVHWLCLGPININSAVKPQSRLVLQPCGVDLPHIYTSVVR
jgi:hypothetical protein